MTESQPAIERTRPPGELNGPQQRRLHITCKYIDKLLSDIENALHSATSQSPFPRYVVDVTPAQMRVIEDHIHRLRSQLLRAMDWQNMKPERPEIPVTRSITTDLAFIDIAIEELKPSYMRGCGAVPEDAIDQLNGVVHELRSLVRSMERFVRQEFAENLETRLLKLERKGYDVDLLRLIEQLVTRHGLVEFRQRIDSLASRLEDNNLEVALFGRVSCGKSSLLNALLGADVLPVGINPITAVPTKLKYGKTLRGDVSYGNGREEAVTLKELAALVTEQGNPANLRNVMRAVVEVPSSRLMQGIVFVDTPGLGSLAKRGAAETLAYLPSCDLALLLIDAGTALNEEDIGTIRLLCEGGIPAIVLLSKADLLGEADLKSVTAYIQEQLQIQLGLAMNVHPVSALPNYASLLDHFFDRELLPRFEQARTLRNSSNARKVGVLRESVIAALEIILDHTNLSVQNVPTNIHNLEEQLRLVTGEVGEQRAALTRAFLTMSETPDAILNGTTDSALSWMQENSQAYATTLQVSEWVNGAVWKAVDRSIESVRDVCRRATSTLQAVAREMGHNEMPTEAETEAVFRDMPRFELAAIPEAINVSRWMFLGNRFVRSRTWTSLQRSIGGSLKQELHLYGQALTQWSSHVADRIVLVVNSYADAYRARLQRITENLDGNIDAPELVRDIARLKSWGVNGNQGASEAVQREA